LTIASVVKLALYARQQEIEIMQLVGAPLSYIRGPFVLEGVFQGGLGALVALAALAGVWLAVRARLGAVNLLPGGGEGFSIAFLSWPWAVALIAGGTLVGCVAGLVAARSAR
jgi:cell division transport system permease protein